MRLSFLLVGWAFLNCCHAQENPGNNPLVLSNISEQTGLSDNHVQCILKDKQGFVWIGTADGLNLMDGSEIKIFKHNKIDSNSLSSNNILSFAEDAEGNTWIGTVEGLNCYHKDQHQFSGSFPPESPYGASRFINSIIIDRKSRIWCATDGGLMRYDPIKKAFTPYYILSREQESNISFSNKMHHMILGSDDRLWLATTDGVWSFDLKTYQFKKEIHIKNDPEYHGLFLYLFEDHDKHLWAGSWQNGLKQLDRQTGKVSNYGSIPFHPGPVNCINEIEQPGGKFILWLNGQLQGFDPQTNKFFQFPKPLLSPEYPTVSPAYRSADGWMWLTSDHGLYIFSPQKQVFHHYFFPSNITSQGVVFAEWNINGKDLLITGGESGSFLKLYDKEWNEVKDFKPSFTGLPFARTAASLAFSMKDDKELWVGNSEGIASVNLVTGENKWFRHREQDSTSLPRDFIADIFFDSKKQLWVFPWREGIWQMNTATGKCRQLLTGFITETDHIKKLLIADATEDADGKIWMADLDEGIILYDPSTQKFSKPFVNQLGQMYHTSRIYLRNGYCYSNTPTAILKWSTREGKLEVFTPPSEIAKILYDMVPDKNGNWWLASKNGLIVFNETSHSFKRYTTADGLVSNDMDGTLFCKQDGTVLLGTPAYFTFFSPDQLSQVSDSTGKTMLTGVLINEKRINWDSSSTLELDHRSTNLVFRWALPDYANPLKNQYYYELEGIDADWKYVGNKGEIQYANLSSGSYTLLLKASTSNGTGSANIIRVHFVIHPPFWKTGWFMFLCITALLGLLIAVVRYISRRNLKERLLRLEKEQAVEKERNRISRDMHDDLGSGLTKIAIMSEVVKKLIHEPDKARQQLDHISESSRELVDNLQDIIWVLNPHNDNLENLAAYIREYGLKFFESFSIHVHFNYPEKFPEIKLSEETRRNIFLVIKESFNNTVKHAWSNNVTVSIEKRTASVFLKIEDDGKGFDVGSGRSFGNGLPNMEFRIQQIGGKYSLVSEPGKGTTITVEMPI